MWFEIRRNLNYSKFADLIVRQQQAELLSKVVLSPQPCSRAKQPFQLEIMTNELVKAGSMNTYTAQPLCICRSSELFRVEKLEGAVGVSDPHTDSLS